VDEKKSRFIIDGIEYERLEDVPEPYRSMIEKGLDAAKAGEAAAAQSSPVNIHTKSSIKFVIGRKGHENMVGLAGPEPLEPSGSNGWVLWIAALAALLGWLAYRLYLRS
jgi:hypothetical protein